MMKETVENMPGMLINGQNIDNLRYADNAALITDEENKIQDILESGHGRSFTVQEEEDC